MRYTVNAAAAMALAASVTPAAAQLLPLAPPGSAVNWTGPYAGVALGADWGKLHGNVAVAGTPAGSVRGSPGVNGSIVGLHNSDDATVTGGGQIGYNYQFPNNIVIGAEGDFRGGGPSGTTGVGVVPGLPNFVPGDHFSTSSDWNGSIRGKLGYAWGPALIYATGGFAFADVNMDAHYAPRTIGGVAVPVRTVSDSSVMTGPTVGGGVEYAVSPNISVGGEYRYSDYGTETLHVGPLQTAAGAGGALATAAVHGHVGLNDNTFMLKVNYRFGAPPPPPLPVAAPAPPPAAAPRVFIVFFDWDKATITPQGMQIVQQAAEAYKSGAPVQIQVTGYTDRSGSAGYNQRLSERRANNVANAMQAQGVPREQMIVSGRGENDNRVPTANGVREPQNRRVEITAP
jgi:outer membrane protein OmpA-like peptidoglycan-associated protein